MSTVKFDIPEWVNWLARDADGTLYGFREKPTKYTAVWSLPATVKSPREIVYVADDPEYYPQVKWTDEEPHFYRNGGTFYNVDVDALLDTYSKIEPSVDVDEVETEDSDPTNVESDMINNPPHYKQYSFEPIDIITEVVAEYPPEIGFHVGTTLKYLFRSPFKGKQAEDLEKAAYYLERANKELSE